jgi:uncharacterized membrane protein
MTSTPDELQNVAPTRAYRLAAMLLGIGVMHFVAPKPFDSIIPKELPGSPRFYTYASGVGEVATGALLVAPRTRRLGALAAIALFVAVFPGNLNHLRIWWDKPWPVRLALIARLPMQLPMIAQAWKVYRTSPAS